MRVNAKWMAAGIALVAGAAVGGLYLRERSTERPNHRTIMTDGDFELRTYPMLVVAETVAHGARDAALTEGFGILADYIGARSRSGEKIAMTAPVIHDPAGEDGGWRTRFIMPGKWTRKTLPHPPGDVLIAEMAARRVAVLRFSGKADDRILAANEEALRQWISDKGLRAAGPAEHAYYSSPMVPGPLRHNELWIPVR